MHAHQDNKAGPKSIRVQISRMGYWGQKMVIGFPVGLVTIAALGLTAIMFSLPAACYVAGAVGYTGIVFDYAWADEKMYFLSSRDTRSLAAIAMIHLCVVGALAAIVHLLVKIDPAIVPRGKSDYSWPFLTALAGVFAVMYGEIYWLAGGKLSRANSGADSR